MTDELSLPPYASELANQDGSIIQDLIRWNGALWFAKIPHGPQWREMLAYLLGTRWLNVAEVAYPDKAIDARWISSQLPFDPLDSADRILIRIAQGQPASKLRVRDLDDAMARELVFSTWIRRRDAHPLNRAYVDGTPIFFDHHIAFDGEAINRPIDTFFRIGPNAGYAGRWRLAHLPKSETPTTEGERVASMGEFAVHRIRDDAAFQRHVQRAARRIKKFTDDRIHERMVRARVSNLFQIGSLLAATRDELDPAVDELLRVLHDPM